MEKRFTTGNATVDSLGKMQFTGNVIPQMWYQTIRKETGKPNLTAIVILSDIVYWYRPVEIRDEGTGALIGYRKRFKADLLQRSYQQLSDQFVISKRDATNAIVELEKLGVLKRVFRNLVINGQTVPNVLFLSLDVSGLLKVTYPDAGKKEPVMQFQEISPKYKGGVPQTGEISPQKLPGYPTCMGDYTENTYIDYPGEYPSSYQQALETFRDQIGYENLIIKYAGDHRLEELISVAVEVLTSQAETIRVNKEERPAALVQAQFGKLTEEHMEYVLDCLEKTDKKITNIRAVMVTSLYNAVNTLSCYAGNLYRYDLAQGTFEGREIT